MKTALFIFCSSLLIYSIGQARLTDNQVVFKVEQESLTIQPKKGFHLNVEAPANATFDLLEAIYKPTTKTEQVFSFKVVPKTKKAKLNFYVCDDKKTVCEQHQDEVALATGASAQGKPLTTAAVTAKSDESLISKNGKPTLLVFSAPWCPACIRMQTETYHTSKVNQEIQKLNFVKLNSDLPENWELSEKFHVRAIPTLILLNAEGQEVYRWLDYQAAPAFAKSLREEVNRIKTSKMSLLKEAALGDSKAISAVGKLYYNALDCAEAVRWLSLSKTADDQKLKLSADVNCSQEEAEKDDKKTTEYLATLEKAIILTPSKIDQTRWLVDWIEKKKDLNQMSTAINIRAENLLGEIEKQLSNKKKLAEDFKLSTFGDSVGFEIAEANLMRSRLFGVLDLKSEKEKSDQKIIQFLKTKKLSVSRPGEMLIAIAYYREAGEAKNVDLLYNQLIAKFPKSYVYFEKYSRYLLKEKKLEPALSKADQALLYPEGNQPQLYLLKARILKELNQKEKALSAVEQAMQVKEIQHVKFKKTLAQLSKLKEEVLKTGKK